MLSLFKKIQNFFISKKTLQSTIQALEEVCNNLHTNLASELEEKNELAQKLNNCVTEKKDLQDKLENGLVVQISLHSTVQKLEEECNNLHTNLANELHAKNELFVKLKNVEAQKEDLHDTLENELAIKVELLEKISSVETENKTIHVEKKIINERYDLVASLLNAHPKVYAELEVFKKLVHENYREFAAQENTLADKAGVLINLQNIIVQLEEIARHPNIVKKQVIAIGGGFSSGKSSFINSLFVDGSPRLPTHINPATAIPAYVTYSDQNSIFAFTVKGGAMPLTMDIYKKMSHNEIEQFKFNLKDQLNFVAITATMSQDYKHLCFIDTPGFNAANTEGSQTEEDVNIASAYLGQADALIWVVGIDSTGTFDRESLDFLESLVNNGAVKKLYIVLNKCDLKPENEVLAILEELTRCLDEANIKYEGLAAYSSRRAKEYAYIEGYLSFTDFLEKMNKANNSKKQDIIKTINENLNQYDLSIRQKIEDLKWLRKTLKDIETEYRSLATWLSSIIDEQAEEIRHLRRRLKAEAVKSEEINYTDLEEKFVAKIAAITKDLDRRSHEENLATLEKLRNNMTQTVELLFAEIQQAEAQTV